MSHCSPSMTPMRAPRKSLRQIVTGIDLSSNMRHDNFSCLSPRLDREVLDLDVTSTRCRFQVIDNTDIGKIISIASAWTILEETQFTEDTAEVPDHLRASNARVEFGLGRAGCRHGLQSRLVRNCGLAIQH